MADRTRAHQELERVKLCQSLDDPIAAAAGSGLHDCMDDLVQQRTGSFGSDQRPIRMNKERAGTGEATSPQGIAGTDHEEPIGKRLKDILQYRQGPTQKRQHILAMYALAYRAGYGHLRAGDT